MSTEALQTDEQSELVQNQEPAEALQEILPVDSGSDYQEPEKESVEDYARKMGWNPNFSPKEPWQKRRTAEEFLQRFEDKKAIRSVEKKINDKDKEIQDLRDKLSRTEEFALKSVQSIEQEKREDTLAQIKAAQRVAISEGDVDRFDELEEKRESLLKQESKFRAPEPERKLEAQEAPDNPAMDEFLEENPWFQTDEELSEYANFLGRRLHKDGYTGKALLKEVARQVREKRPEKFRNEARDRTPPVNDGEVGLVRARNGAANLPSEAKQACERFVENGLSKKLYKDRAEAQKEFVRLYNS